MLYINSWASRSSIIKALGIAPLDTYRLSIKSTKFGESSICGTPVDLLYLLYQLPTKNLYRYEKVLDLSK